MPPVVSMPVTWMPRSRSMAFTMDSDAVKYWKQKLIQGPSIRRKREWMSDASFNDQAFVAR